MTELCPHTCFITTTMSKQYAPNRMQNSEQDCVVIS